MSAPLESDQTEDIAMIVSSALEQERAERNIDTWEGFAEEIGIDYTTLWRWRNGKVRPPTQKLILMIFKHRPPVPTG